MTRARLFRDWAPAVLWAAVLLSAGGDSMSARNSSGMLAWLFRGLTPDQLVMLNWAIRKSAHIVCYGILALLNFRAIRAGRGGWTPQWSIVAVLLALAVSLADEIHQSYSTSRTGTLLDVGFDLWGAVVSQFLVKGRGR